MIMLSTEGKCHCCGEVLGSEAIEGFCSRCLAGAAFKSTLQTASGSEEACATTAPRKLGNYDLLEEIGRGGAGIVYRARQRGLNREVAVKVLREGPFADPAEVERFRREAEAAAGLHDRRIVSIHEVGEADGHAFFSMDLVLGRTLAELTRDGPLEPIRAARYGRAIAQAVAAAHAQGVLHRDLKPSNVIIDSEDEPRVTDFGLAKRIDNLEATVTAQLAGSPGYMPPEQADPQRGRATVASDIYSLGALFYHLLTGRPPFQGETLGSVLIQVQNVEPIALRLLNPSVPPDLETICLKCLEKDAKRRYPTAKELSDELDRFLLNEPILARPISAPEKLVRWCKRQPLVASLAASVAFLLVALSFASIFGAWRVSRARNSEHLERTKAEAANRSLREAVGLLELSRAEDLFATGDSASGVAHLASILRHDPSNSIAAHRLVSALVHRNWALPALPPFRCSGSAERAQFSPDGRQVLVVSGGTATVLNAETAAPIATVMHEGLIRSALYSTDGARFVTASADGTARIFSAGNGAPVSPPLRHGAKVNFAEFNRDGHLVITAAANGVCGIWDAASGVSKRKLQGHSAELLFSRFSPDSRRAATGDSAGTVRIWDVESGEMLYLVQERGTPLTALAFSPDGSRLVVASEDGVARLWDPETPQPVGEPLTHKASIHSAAFSRDGNLLITTSKDTTAQVWNARTSRPIGLLRHDGTLTHGEFSPDGRMVVTTSMDNSARIWDIESGTLLAQPLRQAEGLVHASFSADGRRLVTASDDGFVQIWDIQPRRCKGFVLHPEPGVTSVSFSSDGESALGTFLDGTVRVWNSRTGVLLGDPLVNPVPAHFGEFSREGNRVTVALEDGSARVWDLRTGRFIATETPHSKPSPVARFSPDGGKILTASEDGTARVWDARTGKAITALLRHEAQILTALFSPDGGLVLTASEDRTARIWDAKTGAPLGVPLPHNNHVKWAEFSPNGDRVVTASTDNTAQIWDTRTGSPLGPRLVHARIVEKATFSPDGRRVATGSLDRTARVWNAETGEALTSDLKHGSPVSRLAFSPDGKRVLTGCWDGFVRVWDSGTGRPLTEWLDTEGWLSSACFDSTGEHIMTGAKGVRIWDIPAAPTPVPGWFLSFAEAMAGIRLSERGNTEIVRRISLQDIPPRSETADGHSFYGLLAEWLLQEPKDRSSRFFQ